MRFAISEGDGGIDQIRVLVVSWRGWMDAWPGGKVGVDYGAAITHDLRIIL